MEVDGEDQLVRVAGDRTVMSMSAGRGGGGCGSVRGGRLSGVAHPQALVVPGQTICCEQGYLRGHGTYFEHQDEDLGEEREEHLVSSLAGVIERVNKLVSVRPLSSRYRALSICRS